MVNLSTVFIALYKQIFYNIIWLRWTDKQHARHFDYIKIVDIIVYCGKLFLDLLHLFVLAFLDFFCYSIDSESKKRNKYL